MTPQQRYARTAKGRATRLKYRSSEKGRAYDLQYRLAPERIEAQKRIDGRSFMRFKKSLAARIECLRHTSPAFREARIQEILNWAGSRHSYWVESEIQSAID